MIHGAAHGQCQLHHRGLRDAHGVGATLLHGGAQDQFLVAVAHRLVVLQHVRAGALTLAPHAAGGLDPDRL